MKKLSFIFVLMSVLFSCGNKAQDYGYPTGSLLWKVSGNGLNAPSYILGTFHIKPGTFLDSIAGATRALGEVEQVVGEISMANAAETAMQIMPKMLMPADTTYQMLYSDEDYAFVNEALKKQIGFGLDNLASLKPMAIEAQVVLIEFTKELANFDPNNVLDAYVQTVAIQAGKPVVGLETAEQQADMLFSSNSLARQAEILLCVLKDSDTYVAGEIKKLTEGYDKADFAVIDEMMNEKSEGCPSTPEEDNILIKNRNSDWAEKLPAIMQDRPSFVAVGAAHLVGEFGILNLLKNKGFNVEAVKK